MTLPKDFAKCRGVGSDDEGWREGCEQCLRLTTQPGDHQSWIEPPAIIAFECEYLIEREQ